MEAATPLRPAQVTSSGDRLTVSSLVVDDATAARIVRERQEAGEDPAATVGDAIEIGARVLDREQAGANAEFVKAEFEKAARELEVTFTDKARTVAEHFGSKVDEVFGPDNGQLAREFEKLFSDGSAGSVQNRVRELVAESLAKSREEMVRQFSAADGSNPLADFKASTVRELHKAGAMQQALLDRLGQLEKQLEGLRTEREKDEEIEAERERGTAKGRSFEELVADAVDALAVSQGDCAQAVGDLKGATGKTGDVVVELGAAAGPGRGRVVFEAKDRRLSRPRALEELDSAMTDRDADFAVLVVPGDEEVPARLEPLREYNGDKLIVTLDPDDGSALSLELGYRLARARVLMHRAGGEGVDAGAVRDAVERASAAMEDVRKVKSQLTGAKTSIDRAREIVEAMAGRVRAQLDEIDRLALGEEPSPELGEPPSDDSQPELGEVEGL